MSEALAVYSPHPQPTTTDICGECGGRLTCNTCSTDDLIQQARSAISECVRGSGGRGALTRLMAAKMILDKAHLEHLSDEDLLAEVERRAKRLTAAAKKG